MNRRRKIQPVVVTLVIVVAAGILGMRMRQNGQGKPAPQTAAVERGPVVSSVSGNGLLEAVTTVEVRSNVGGQVTELAVDEGDHVRAGQLIARIDPADSTSTLDQARADYASALAKVEQAQQGLTMQRLQTSANTASATHAVESAVAKLEQARLQSGAQPALTTSAIGQAQGALDAAISSLDQTRQALAPQKIADAQSAFDSATAGYDQAQRELAREQSLLDKGFTSRRTVDAAAATCSQAKAQLDSARQKLGTVKAEANEDIRTAEARVAQARGSLATAQANSVDKAVRQRELDSARASVLQARAALSGAMAAGYQDRMKGEELSQARSQLLKSGAMLKNAQTQLTWTTVTAPRDGVVVKKYAEKGSIVAPGRSAIGGGTGTGITIVEIADISHMRVVVDVPETDIGKIHLAQDVDVTVDACAGELFHARVTRIAPKATVTQNVTTVPVTVELAGSDARLKPAMNATCEFIVDRKQDALYVPIEAVVKTDAGSTVTVVERGVQSVRNVTVGLVGNDTIEITQGLQQGQVVIVPDEEPVKKSDGGPGGPPPF